MCIVYARMKAEWGWEGGYFNERDVGRKNNEKNFHPHIYIKETRKKWRMQGMEMSFG